jgi:hypothetical protein
MRPKFAVPKMTFCIPNVRTTSGVAPVVAGGSSRLSEQAGYALGLRRSGGIEGSEKQSRIACEPVLLGGNELQILRRAECR